MPEPGVSAIIPVFNGARFIAQAIDSVLTQARPVSELIVLDDGSTDGSGDIAAAYGEAVRVVRQDNRGLGAARNVGIAASRCEYIAFLDADDVWLPDKIGAQLALLEADASLDGVFGLVDHFFEPGSEGTVNVSQAAVGVIAGTLMIRRRAFDGAGPFSEDRRLPEFIDWYGRAVDAGLRFETLNQVVLRRRIHDANMSRTSTGTRPDYVRAMRESLARRRER